MFAVESLISALYTHEVCIWESDFAFSKNVLPFHPTANDEMNDLSEKVQ